MENNKKQVGVSSSSTTFDHLFGPKYPSSATSSSSTSGIFGSIFPPPSTVLGRDSTHDNRGGSGKYGNPDIITKNNGKGESAAREKGSASYQKDHEIMEPCYFNSEPACYFSSSIYYGGQENYSPRTRSTESQHIFKKDGGDDDSNGNNPNSASRGNWWQGSLYY